MRGRPAPVVTAAVMLALVGGAGTGSPAFSSARATLRAHPVKASPPPAGSYTVRKGDTLIGLARRLGVSVGTLVTANKLADPDRLRSGTVLTVPRPAEPEPAAPAVLPPLASPVVVVGGGSRHRVAEGENLARIARRYGTTVAALAETNKLSNPNRVRAGADLEVPGPKWICPVEAPRQFTDSWGAPRGGGRRHLGIDIFAARGTPVVASVGGLLTHSRGAAAGLAYYLKGDDGYTYYGAHLHTLEAGVGRVERGARIGTVGSTGNAKGTTPHLHFEIKPGGGAPVNPMPSLERWCRG